MNQRGKTFVGIILAVLLTVGACAKEEQATFTGGTTQDPPYQDNLNAITPAAYGEVEGLNLEPGTYISIIGKAEEPAYWRNVKEGVMQAAEDLNEALGYTGSDKIKVTYNAPAREEDINEQVNILDEELSRNPDVIGIASVDEEACTVQFDLATWNGIPIIALDSGNQYQGIQCTVKTDNEDAARTGAYKLADEMGRAGDIVLLAHDSKSETAKERVQSFQIEIEENYPDVCLAEIVYCDALEELKKQIAEEENARREEGEREITAESISDEDAVQYVMEQCADLRGVFGTNPAATQLGLRAIQNLKKEREEKASLKKKTKDSQEEGKTAGEKEKDSQEEDKAAGEKNRDTALKGKKDGEDTEETLSSDPEKADAQAESEAPAGDKALEGAPEDAGAAEIVLMGFDAGEEQIRALENGEISGLIVQNPFGIGYASVVAAARTVLQAGNEANVGTGYIWLTSENLNDESIQKMIYR